MQAGIKSPKYDSFTPSSSLSSLIKSRTKSKNTRAELMLRHHLWSLGLRYRLHVRNLPGKPDLVFHSAKVVVFCDGDFWHGRNWKKLRKDLKYRKNAQYWIQKIETNIKRDIIQTKALQRIGWYVVRFWETDILKNPSVAAQNIFRLIKSRHPYSFRVVLSG